MQTLQALCIWSCHKSYKGKTDHNPLEPIFLKPLNSAPKRLQRMLPTLQKYNLSVTYKKGCNMFLANTLHRAFLWVHTRAGGSGPQSCSTSQGRALATNQTHLSRWPVLQQLQDTIRCGWPEKRTKVPECLHPYFNIRDVLTIQNELVFKGQLLVVPTSLWRELMAVLLSSHIGIEGCVCRACDTLYWPCMVTELQQYISKCDIYTVAAKPKNLSYSTRWWPCPSPKSLLTFWKLDNRTLLVISNYYSKFIEVACLKTVTSWNVIKEMKAVFLRYGIPDVLITETGPQFASAEFVVFAKPGCSNTQPLPLYTHFTHFNYFHMTKIKNKFMLTICFSRRSNHQHTSVTSLSKETKNWRVRHCLIIRRSKP